MSIRVKRQSSRNALAIAAPCCATRTDVFDIAPQDYGATTFPARLFDWTVANSVPLRAHLDSGCFSLSSHSALSDLKEFARERSHGQASLPVPKELQRLARKLVSQMFGNGAHGAAAKSLRFVPTDEPDEFVLVCKALGANQIALLHRA